MQTIESLRFQKIDKLYIHAIDMCVYLAEVQVSGNRSYIRNSAGQIARFSSRSEILDKFDDLAVLEAWLVHRSAYDEMIGGPLKADNELLLKLF
jgi:hypothetical protein